jgi:hypothetical protein
MIVQVYVPCHCQNSTMEYIMTCHYGRTVNEVIGVTSVFQADQDNVCMKKGHPFY